MVRGIEAGTDLDNLVARASVLVLGPGLGQSDWSAMVFDRLIESEQTMVVDADGLNLLAKDPRQKSNWVLTPHPGEAARLLDEKDIEADRFTSIARLQTQYGGTVVLKGVGSLVADGAALDLCPYGNPGMATACTATANRVATPNPSPWASSAAITPARTSPIPAVAMPGLP